jgi:7,8-dihydro-6-hydroxymethylpterin dimethyltransferase
MRIPGISVPRPCPPAALPMASSALPLPHVSQPVRALRSHLEQYGLWSPAQVATRRWAIGCVSLEVTQRCNLDCTLCYLSEHAQAMRDPPLDALLARIDAIAQQFGPGTDVQLSGGDPTLRPLPDLVALVRRLRARGLRGSLLTNGIRASREMLQTLADAGLSDVAFHVDLTQQRKGHPTEASLDPVREAYIERARGLGLQVFFNTTVFEGNLDEVPHLVRFFMRHVDVVRFASFQLGADTGRGLHGRDGRVTQAAVIDAVQRGAGRALAFDTFLAGHPRCNRAAMVVVAGGTCVDLLDDPVLAHAALARTVDVEARRDRPWRTAAACAWRLGRQFDLWPRAARWAVRAAWQLRRVRLGRGATVGKLTFFLHGFMDAAALERERLDTCVFMAATPAGFMPMCEFNARRDEILLPVQAPAGQAVAPGTRAEHVYPIRLLRGRPRARALAARRDTGAHP